MSAPTPAASREEILFVAAVQLPAADRAAYLAQACVGDATLLARVNALLSSDEAAASFMADSAAAGLATAVNLQAPPPDAAAGDRVGRYKLLHKIGEGGCGAVFVAEQEEPVRRRVALKIIKLGMDTKEVVARFEAERQALALMDHPNIARVFDAGATATGRPFFVMELVRGLPITRFCDEHNLAMEARLELFAQVCQAVQHAHQKGVIHRDLKPSNILVALHDGVPVPKVIDFGIAKATQGRLTEATMCTAIEQFVGTPAYMSPEQAELSGRELDPRSDIYSLGVLLYELLTGRPPFDPKELLSAGLDEIRRLIREIDPPRPSLKLTTLEATDRASVAKQRGTSPGQLSTRLRGDLDWIVMRCLEKQRGRRYENAGDLATDVRRHLKDEPVAARPPSALYRLRKFVRRHRVLLASGLAVVAAAAGGLVLATWLSLGGPARVSDECLLFRSEIDRETGRLAGQPMQITPGSIIRRDPPSISPDGRQIAYWHRGTWRSGLAVMDARGGSHRIVSSHPGHGQIVWLGADEVVFQEALHHPSEPTKLVRLNLKSGMTDTFARADISATGMDWQFVPVRNEIVYLSREAGPKTRTFKAHSLATGATRTIAKVENLTSFRHCFRVSPDGKTIAYGVWVDRNGGRAAEIRSMSIEGMPEKTLLPAPDELQVGWRPSGFPYAWSPNGKFLLYDQYPGGIAILDIATGEKWPVPGAADKPPHEWGLAAWSPDGAFLVINRYRSR